MESNYNFHQDSSNKYDFLKKRSSFNNSSISSDETLEMILMRNVKHF